MCFFETSKLWSKDPDTFVHSVIRHRASSLGADWLREVHMTFGDVKTKVDQSQVDQN